MNRNTWISLFGVALGIALVMSPGSFASAAIIAPTDLGGLQLWLDASDAGSVTLSGSHVQTWNDKSGQSNHVTAAGIANQPLYELGVLNGRNLLTFDGSNDSLGGVGNVRAIPGVSDTFDVFLVALPQKAVSVGGGGTSGQAYVWAPQFNPVPTSGTRHAGLSLSTNGMGVYEHTNGYLGVQTSITRTNPSVPPPFEVYSVRYDAQAPEIWVNNAAVQSGGTSTAAIVNASLQFGDVGGSGTPSGFGAFQGHLAEAIVYDRRLTPTEFGDVVSYLDARWNGPYTPFVPSSISLSTDVMGPGRFNAGYNNNATASTVELVQRIANTNAAPLDVAYTQNPADTIDFSPWVVSGAWQGNWGSDTHGRGGNLYILEDGETNEPHAGFGAHANWFVTFDLDDVRTAHLGSFDGDLLLDGKFGRWGGIADGNPIAGVVQGAIFVDGVRIDSMGETLRGDPSFPFSLAIPADARWLTLAILNGTASASWDDGNFRDVTLSVVASEAVPEPSTLVLALAGVLGLALVARRRRRKS